MAGRRHAGIFGSPPEPLFNQLPHGMKPELLEEWLIVLAQENATAMETAKHTQCMFKGREATEFLFLTCDKLKLPLQAKYLATELLDRFMERHIHDLYAHVQASRKRSKRQDWQTILDRIRNQLLLRVVSCCQLASKLTSHYRIITPKRAQHTLREFGHKYSLDSVLQSELRVIKTLNYRVMITSPLMYIETLLEILGHNDTSHEIKEYHGVSVKVMDHLYMNWQLVYSQLFRIALRQSTPTDKHREKFASVERDYMLLAVGVIAAASYVLDQHKTDTVIEQLQQITRIPPDDILDFATVLVQSILDPTLEAATACSVLP